MDLLPRQMASLRPCQGIGSPIRVTVTGHLAWRNPSSPRPVTVTYGIHFLATALVVQIRLQAWCPVG